MIKERYAKTKSFIFSPKLLQMLEKEVQRTKQTESNIVRLALTNWLTRKDESVHINVDVGHGEKVQAPLSAVVSEYLKSIRIIVDENQEFIDAFLYRFFESWRRMKRAGTRKKKKGRNLKLRIGSNEKN